MRSTAEERPGFLRGENSELNEGNVKEFASKKPAFSSVAPASTKLPADFFAPSIKLGLSN